MTLAEILRDWLERHTAPGWQWYLKFLSANDTLATGGHQYGPYIPKDVAFSLFPSLRKPGAVRPDAKFAATIDSHGDMPRNVRIVYYNDKSRDECRITRWGGKRSPILDTESTGSLCIFAFFVESGRPIDRCDVWVCENADEIDACEEIVGSIEPGPGLLYRPFAPQAFAPPTPSHPCVLKPQDLPLNWLTAFPDGEDLVEFAVRRLPVRDASPDSRLVLRRECEFRIFEVVERAFVLPRISEPFATVDEFIDFANTVLNRRKSRSGKSLELHALKIFNEENLEPSHGAISEGRKRPDFLFPSAGAYRDMNVHESKLLMLGVKTTCKDRWRQILNEADRIKRKHLLTLQEGVSLNQLKEMEDEGVQLVVPGPLVDKFPRAARSHIMTLSQFIALAHERCA